MKNKGFTVFVAVASLLIVGLSITVAVLIFSNDKPDYNPIEPDKNLDTVIGGGDIFTYVQEGGGAVNITYSPKVEISLEGKTAKISFLNPEKSLQSMRIKLVIHDEIFSESGLIPPGSHLGIMEISDEMLKRLKVGVYNAELFVTYYDEKAELASVTTTLDVEVTVTT